MADHRELLERLTRPSLQRLADGRWHNFLSFHDREESGLLDWFRRVLSVGVALESGLVEQDEESWFRITEAGRRALADGEPPAPRSERTDG